MASGLDETVRVGVLRATPVQLAQIEAWVADFRSGHPAVEAVDKIGLERFDLYLVILDAVTSAEEFGRLVAQTGFTPCLALGSGDDDALVDVALAAGASDFLALPTLDAAQLERALQFGLRRRRVLDALSARESSLVAARERELQQLANSLHDGPLQDLIGARFLLGALAVGEDADEIQNSLQSVIQTIRLLGSELKPPALGPFGLGKAIRAHMQSLQARHPDLAVTLELDVDNQLLPEWARMALFRVYQAALSNVTKHANASHLLVRLSVDEQHVRLTVADDGQGFDLPADWLEFARTERCGLLMMQERVDALQGRMMVQSTSGTGTRVTVQVPVAQPLTSLPTYLASIAQERNAQERNGKL